MKLFSDDSLEFLILTVGDDDLGMKTWAKRQLTEETYASRSEGLLRDISELSSQRDQLREEQAVLQQRLSVLMGKYNAEVNGTGKSGKAGRGSEAASYASQIDLQKLRLIATSEQISQLDMRIDGLREQLQLLLVSSASRAAELEHALQGTNSE